ncbi:MAG TPA: Tex family protein, partial [Polyangia bacterium]|nr:Tex family protein [Polyangia bacterium]
MPLDVVSVIAEELKLNRGQVERTLALFTEGATVPFIARYRKEATGGLDEVQITTIQERGEYFAELLSRKQTVLTSIDEQGKLTPELRARIEGTTSRTELEDLYLPYKPKRRTRAKIARERGLEPLAEMILAQARGLAAREALAAPFVSAEREVPDVEAAFAGARDIVAEVISETPEVRAALREQALATAVIISEAAPPEAAAAAQAQGSAAGLVQGAGDKGGDKKANAAKFKDYFDHREPVGSIPSHRMLALRRGEKEGFLKLTLEVDREAALDLIRHRVVKDTGAALARDLAQALVDAYDRLLQPSIEVDVRLALKERADTEAITVFSENLRHLLLAAPLGSRRVLAVDPGFRTGCKVVVVDEKGDLVHHEVLHLTTSERLAAEAEDKVKELCRRHRVEAVAIGNGTGGRETEVFFRKLQTAGQLGDVKIVMVNEAGASVYSASEVAREELPEQDVTVRGAVSIGRRLQDPLAELVKIDPKSIGVGQYQHDVHQPKLRRALDGVVESCVNHVGVDVNTASVKLLQYVAGVGETLAKNIVERRSTVGRFKSRQDLLQVPRLGPKAFEQSAGFLRVPEGQNPLDNSAVHPESYDVVARMAKDLGVEVSQLVGKSELLDRIDIRRYVDERRGEPTLRDIVAELKKPGRDPRAEFTAVGFRSDVTEFEHLKEDMVLEGVVSNVTQFGAFVDVGVHQDGLVHVSELSHKFVKDPAEVVKVGDRVKVKVIKLDPERRRIGLSIRQATEAPRGTGAGNEGAGARSGGRPGGGGLGQGRGQGQGQGQGRGGGFSMGQGGGR